MARVTPTGTRIEWRLSTPPGATGQHGWPFMIEDITPRALRVPHAPEEIRHANGASGVAGITVLVRDVDTSAKAYEAILGLQPQTGRGSVENARLFVLNEAWIELREPGSSEERRHLERHGQGPYRLTLRSRRGAADYDAGSLL